MATLGDPPAKDGRGTIVDDFMYGSNVATAHIYIRMGFLRKVYGILAAQLVLTTLMTAVFIMNDNITLFVQENQWMMLVAFIGSFGSLLGLLVKRQDVPANYILLGVFTVFEAYSVAVLSTFYEVSSVLEAFVLTSAVVVSLTLYTLQSKRDFSAWGAGLFAALWVLLIASIIQMFLPTPMMDKGIAVAGAILFSLFIIFDTHMMMHKLSPEEYVMAAINLYLDILNLFIFILRIFGQQKN